ncbi:MAG: acyl dehydratase [Actinomycetota bacterium]|nr:acyl dehydratase [Actinomycetota bacterium]
MTTVAGPWFEDLTIGQVVDEAPGVTLTVGLSAAHQAILADRLRLPLDHHLSIAVAGGPTAHPGLVCDVAIGQSTLVTGRVKANLFYRGLVLHRLPQLGDTLRTSTEVVALKQNSSGPTGLAALRVHTVDQKGRTVLDFHRCAMLPLYDPDAKTGHQDDVKAVATEPSDFSRLLSSLDLDAFRRLVPGKHEITEGEVFEIPGGDVVSNAPELARLTLNVATAHHDAPTRLVYGGHTIGLGASHLSRALPNLVTVAGWHSCDHLAPVHEGDVLRSAVEVERVEGPLAHLRVTVSNQRGPVLDWRLVGVTA